MWVGRGCGWADTLHLALRLELEALHGSTQANDRAWRALVCNDGSWATRAARRLVRTGAKGGRDVASQVATLRPALVKVDRRTRGDKCEGLAAMRGARRAKRSPEL